MSKFSSSENEAAQYDENFSEFYENYLTGQAQRAAQDYINYLQNVPLSTGKVLDLMCGPGTLLGEFSNVGWKTYGIDLSSKMIEIASQKYKNTEFIVGNATYTKIKEHVNAVISTSDSFNHLPTFADLVSVFENASDMLEDGGYFIFDMNTPLGIKNNSYYVASEDEMGMVIREGFVDEGNSLGFTRFKGFYRLSVEEPLYKRFSSLIYNYMYDVDDILDAVTSTGFKIERLFDADQGTEFSFERNTTERLGVIAQRES